MTAVLHVISGLATGGAETTLMQIAGALHARKLPQHVVSIGDRGAYADELEQRGVAVTTLGMKSAYGGLAGLFKLVRLVQRVQPKFIQGWMYHGNLMASLADRLAHGRADRRLIWNLRASNMDEARYGWIIRLTTAMSAWPDMVIANSQAGVAFHIARGYHPWRVELIANGIDVEKFQPNAAMRSAIRAENGIPADAVLVIHAARVDPMKDHATFLAAMEAVPNVFGLLVGAGTKELRLPPNVRALGLRHDIGRFYACADIVVSTSAFGEGFSNAIAEGMSSGLVPIATDVGDARLIIGETGRIVATHDPAALAEAIAAEAAIAPAERRSRGEQARKRILTHFSLSQAVDVYERVYLSFEFSQAGPIGRELTRSAK